MSSIKLDWSIVISVFSLMIAFLSFGFSVYPNELKALIGEREIRVVMSPEMQLSNGVRGILYQPEILIENIGYKPIKVREVNVAISAGSDIYDTEVLEVISYRFTNGNTGTPSSFTIKPDELYKFIINSTSRIGEKSLNKKSELWFKMFHDLSKKYHCCPVNTQVWRSDSTIIGIISLHITC